MDEFSEISYFLLIGKKYKFSIIYKIILALYNDLLHKL